MSMDNGLEEGKKLCFGGKNNFRKVECFHTGEKFFNFHV